MVLGYFYIDLNSSLWFGIPFLTWTRPTMFLWLSRVMNLEKSSCWKQKVLFDMVSLRCCCQEVLEALANVPMVWVGSTGAGCWRRLRVAWSLVSLVRWASDGSACMNFFERLELSYMLYRLNSGKPGYWTRLVDLNCFVPSRLANLNFFEAWSTNSFFIFYSWIDLYRSFCCLYGSSYASRADS